MRVLPGTPESAGTGARSSQIIIIGSEIVRAIVVSNQIGDERTNTCEPARIIVYDRPDVVGKGVPIKTGFVGGYTRQLTWTGKMPITNGAIRAIVVLEDSNQVGLWCVID